MALMITSLLSWSWLPLLLLVPLLVLLKVNQKNSKKGLRLPPSPPQLPFLGNLHQVSPSPHINLWNLAKKYGPVMFVNLGSVPTVVVSSAEGAKEVLKTNDLLCCSRPSYPGSHKLTYGYLDMAFGPYTEYWREIRKIGTIELFSVKRVGEVRYVREQEVAKMVKTISESAGSPVNLTAMLFGYAASIVFRVGYGTKLEETRYKTGKEILQLLHDIEPMIGGRSGGDYFPAWIGWFIDWATGVHKHNDKISKEVDSFFQELVDGHLKPGRKREHEDIIDVLLKAIKNQTSVIGAAKRGHDSVKSALLNLLLGGIDTSAVTMTWAMAELSRKPHLMKKAQDEVRKVVGDKGIASDSDIEQLHYLKLIVKETLRLHPAVPLMLPREVMSPFKIQGFDIETKTQIFINSYAIARDPASWKNPNEFIPERFDGSPLDYKGTDYEYLPFGGGRRVCPGIYMGITGVEFALANILYSFDWKFPDGMRPEDVSMEETSGVSALTVSKKTPVSLIPVPVKVK